MNKPIEIKTNDYSAEYGGVPVMIGNDECSFGSVVGYALYNEECPIAALNRSQKLKHKLHWINRSASVLCSDKGYYEQQAKRRAAMPKLAVGDVVRYEGQTFKIVRAPNSNYALESVK